MCSLADLLWIDGQELPILLVKSQEKERLCLSGKLGGPALVVPSTLVQLVLREIGAVPG